MDHHQRSTRRLENLAAAASRGKSLAEKISNNNWTNMSGAVTFQNNLMPPAFNQSFLSGNSAILGSQTAVHQAMQPIIETLSASDISRISPVQNLIQERKQWPSVVQNYLGPSLLERMLPQPGYLSGWMKSYFSISEVFGIWKTLEELGLSGSDLPIENLRRGTLTIDEIFEKTLKCGLPLYGSVNRDLALRLIQSSPEESNSILLEEEEGIIQRCHECINGAQDSGRSMLEGRIVQTYKALSYLKSGENMAAQVLATLAADSILRMYEDEVNPAKIKQRGGKLLTHLTSVKGTYALDDYAPTDRYRSFTLVQAFVLAGTWDAWKNVNNVLTDPLPTYFNRHVTVHASRLEHFTRVNALRAVMIASSLIWGDEHMAFSGEGAIPLNPEHFPDSTSTD